MCRLQYNEKKEEEKRANVAEKHEKYLLDIIGQTTGCLTQLTALRNELQPK